MAVTNHGDRHSLSAAADLSAKKFYIVKQTTDTAVNLASAGTDDLLGTLNNKPVSGETASISRFRGGSTVKVILGATLARGARITSDANGKAAASATGQKFWARLLQGGVLNDIVEAEGEEGVTP